MHQLLSQSSTLLSPTLPGRFVIAFAEATRAAVETFQTTWQNHPPCAEQSGTLELMSDINAHTLKDIGAPNWLIAQAVERRDSHHLRLIELYRS